MRQWGIAIAAAALAGCSLGEFKFGGSESAPVEQLAADIVAIKSTPNASTEDVLLKAAQTARSAGASHFKLISAADVGRPTDSSRTGALPQSASPTIRPGQDTYIRLLRLPSGQEPPGGYFSVDEIFELMGRRAIRG